MTRSIQHDETILEKLLLDGRGKGDHSTYNPFIHVTDFSSLGTSSRVNSVRFDQVRGIHLLSTWEVLHFYCVESLTTFDDFQEQYYLPLEETVKIAEKLGVEHPHANNRSNRPHWLMTTDALITLNHKGQKRRYARAIKPSNQLTPTTVAKFEIERTYWLQQDVDWGIITERDIPQQYAMNFSWLRTKYTLSTIPDQEAIDIGNVLLKILQAHEIALASAAQLCDGKLGLEAGTSLEVAYFHMARNYWLIDLFQPLMPENPLHLLNVPSTDK